MSNDNIKKNSVHQCCDVKEYLGVNGLNNCRGLKQNETNFLQHTADWNVLWR